jgi:DNA-directed RNA polymerase specialized sigma24 family protein
MMISFGFSLRFGAVVAGRVADGPGGDWESWRVRLWGIYKVENRPTLRAPAEGWSLVAAAASLGRADGLAARTSSGDREAFVSLYGPDFDGLFDLALRTVREREAAGAAVRAGLERAWDLFREEGAPYAVGAWLHVLVRDAALARPAAKRMPLALVVEREAVEYTQVDTSRLSDPSIAFDKELVELVWDAAAALDRDGYSLLDLHLRHDLSVDELAEQLELPREQLAWQLSRLCTALENSVASTLLATRARHNCEDLDAALSSNGMSVARSVQRHVHECADCRETKRRFPSSTEILGSLSPLQPPAGLRERIARVFLAQGKRRGRKLR